MSIHLAEAALRIDARAADGTVSSRDIHSKIRPWQVVHACEFARDIADIIDLQVTAGMRPYLLTVGTDKEKASFLQTWQDVRGWRRALDESGAHTTPELIHAHSFAAGMAAVRLGACVVYDLRMTIEERLAANGSSGVWLTSSFRTAEQFVLAKAAAVVVHSTRFREECIARGVSAEYIFSIPDPVMQDSEEFFRLGPEEQREMHETRRPKIIAEKYDEAYRCAFMRRRKGDSANSSGSLVAIEVGL